MSRHAVFGLRAFSYEKYLPIRIKSIDKGIFTSMVLCSDYVFVFDGKLRIVLVMDEDKICPFVQ